jgi:predicted transcriptional regulator
MSETTFTFQLDESLKEEFTAAAKRANRGVEEVLCDLVREFVECETPANDDWFRRKVQAGLDDANAGRLVSGEEVEAEFAARRAETLRKLRSGP